MEQNTSGSSMSVSWGEVPFHIGNTQINDLIGKLLTLLDASISDQVQRKALKDVVMNTVWQWIEKEERGVFNNHTGLSLSNSTNG